MTAKLTQQERQRQQLATWLALYELDRHLREPDIPEPNRAGKVVSTPRQPTAAGQIRLLPPARDPLPEIERPVYGLLVPGANDQATTLIPFSRFAIPATPQEWRTGLALGPLQVLCLWNARVMQTDAFASTWVVRNMPARTYQMARTAYQDLHAPDAWCPQRFGPPLRHPLDPRHIYLQEERMLLDAVCSDLQAHTRGDNTIPYHIPEPDTQMLRAAEPPRYPDDHA